jgi:hypothetical protein
VKLFAAVILTLVVVGVTYAAKEEIAALWDRLYTKVRNKVNSVFNKMS